LTGGGDGVRLEIAMQWNDSYNETIYSFANSINTVEGGTHMVGFKAALTRTINAYLATANLGKDAKDLQLQGEDVREGLAAVVSVKIPSPNSKARPRPSSETPKSGPGRSAGQRQADRVFRAEPAVAKSIILKSVDAARAREAARKARELTRRKGRSIRDPFPGSSPTARSATRLCEIFLVEGDSAGGSAKQGRNRRFRRSSRCAARS
jgi:DNA gyrase subunit B